MACNVVPGQWLFDHDQLEVVEPEQVVGVGEGVGVVRVRHQRRVGTQPVADGPEVGEILSRLDLQLDLPVTGGERRLGLRCQFLGRALDADRDAGADPLPRAAEQGGEAAPGLGRSQRPGAHLDRRLRHLVASEVLGKSLGDLLRRFEAPAEHPWCKPRANRQHRGVDALWRVVGEVAGDALGPGRSAVRVDKLQEQDTARRRDAGRDPEGFHQRQPDLAQGNRLDLQAHLASEGSSR